MIEQIQPLPESIKELKKIDAVAARCLMAVMYYQKKTGISNEQANQL